MDKKLTRLIDELVKENPRRYPTREAFVEEAVRLFLLDVKS